MTAPVETWNVLLERSEQGGTAQFSPNELAVLRVNIFLIEVETGGLSGLLYNLSPDGDLEAGWLELKGLRKALSLIGSTASAAVVQRISAILEGKPAAEASSWAQFLVMVDPAEELERFESELLDQVEAIWGELESFTVKHLLHND